MVKDIRVPKLLANDQHRAEYHQHHHFRDEMSEDAKDPQPIISSLV
ncbi:Uncharacterised protein [Vibrio cholerae]|nr:Uncharacterised protein [Vibrio cholerae]